jgi:hypothetical protein
MRLQRLIIREEHGCRVCQKKLLRRTQILQKTFTDGNIYRISFYMIKSRKIRGIICGTQEGLSPVKKTEHTAVGIRRADHATTCTCKKLALASSRSGGTSVGTVRSRTNATELCLRRNKIWLQNFSSVPCWRDGSFSSARCTSIIDINIFLDISMS